MSFFDELKRRNVFRVGAAYAIGAWLLAQVTDLVGENFDLPEWLVQTVLIALAIGLPIALILAWVFELTPDGVKRDSEVDRSQPVAGKSGRTLDRLIIVALVIALGYFIWEARLSSSAVDSMEVIPGETPDEITTTPEADTNDENSIAVLPFENFSGDNEDEYFADGLADTLLHKLAQIQDLKVIARNSSFQFKGTNRDIREIGEILGVATVLEGSVQRYGEQVRVIAQLIDTTDGRHIWSETFDDRMDNIFALQDNIAEQIVGQLELNLSEEDRSRLLKNGTENTEAYDFYMLAMAENLTSDEVTETDEEGYLRLRLLKRAVEADPQFVEAWAGIADAYNILAFLTESNEEFVDYVRKGREAAERAVTLDEDFYGAYVSLGFLGWRERKINEAIRNYRLALELNPNSAGAHAGLGLALLRSDPEEALRLFTRSGELNPEEPLVYRQKSFALMALGRNKDAISLLEDAARRFPDEFLFVNDIAGYQQYLYGHVDESALWVSRFLQANGASLNGSLQMAMFWMMVDDEQRAESWVQFSEQRFGESDATMSTRRQMLQFRGRYSAAREYSSSNEEAEFSYAYKQHSEAVHCLFIEDYSCALRQANLVLQADAEFSQRGNQNRSLRELGLLVSGIAHYEQGDQQAGEEAFAELHGHFDGASLMPRSLADEGKGYVLAILYANEGNEQMALDELEATLSLPGDAFIPRDIFGSAPDYSLLLENLRDNPAYLDWQIRFRERRSSMYKRMVEWEEEGKLVTPEQLK